MSAIEILAVIGIIGYVIYRQVKGEPARGRRTVLLPAVLTLIGLINLNGSGGHLTGTDIACLAVGTAGSAAIGLAFGAVMRLESRGGYLWAQLPLRGLWLWAALAGWRVLVMVVATGLHAHVAASTATLLLSLGINRLAQAGVVVVRATGMGVPFAPEKDGRLFMGGTFGRGLSGDDGAPGDRFGSADDRRGGYDGIGEHAPSDARGRRRGARRDHRDQRRARRHEWR